MPRSAVAWATEIAAHHPQTCDFAVLTELDPGLTGWRIELLEDPELRDSLGEWELFVQANGLAVVLEQCVVDCALLTEAEIALRLQECPIRWRAPAMEFMRCAPRPLKEYLALSCWNLVQTERQRRTGRRDWPAEAVSGSREVLEELMFKWGPRFRRHRWSW